MKYPQKLISSAIEKWELNGNSFDVPKCILQMEKWCGEAVKETFGGKPILAYNNKPMFAELAIMNIFLEDGWEARWIETYGRSKKKPICLKEWKDDKYANQVHAPIQSEPIIDLIKVISENNADSYAGCWDVIAWKGDQILFAESKRSKKDKIRQTQINWFLAGLNAGLTVENFLIVEWEFK